MSQSNFGNLESPLNGTNFFNTYLEPWRDALHTMHSGSSRPLYAVAGTMWLDTTTTPWVVKVFDGTDDISIGTINATTNLFAAANAVSLAGTETLTNKTLTDLTLTGTISGSAAPKINNFRLTLTTGVPVTTSDVTAASTIFLTPYNGNQIALFTAGQWVLLSSAQVSIALSGLTSSRPYDLFAWNNAGVVTLETLVWTNDTTRATALAYQDGVLVRSGDATRRYLGTFYATGATTTADSAANRYLWNYYNRVVRLGERLETTTSWTYSTAAWRQANGSSANQINFVVGVAEDSFIATLMGDVANSTGTPRLVGVGIGLDTVSIPSGNSNQAHITPSTTLPSSVRTIFASSVTAGRHYLAWLEYGAGVDTQTWRGNPVNAGLSMNLMM